MGLILRSIVTCLFFTYAIGVEFKYPVDKPCIMAQVNISFTLSDQKEKHILSEPQVDPGKSNCSSIGNTAILALKWKDSNDTMTFTFMLNNGIVEMSVEYELIPSQHFNNSQESDIAILKYPSPLELSLRNMSYKCDSSQDVILKDKTYQLVMSVAKLQVQAFGVENGTFSNFKECSADTSTTKNPETTTEHSQTTGPQPTDNPPTEYEYQYPESGSACILLNSAIQLHINYMDKNNATVTAKVNIPSNLEVKVTGQCAVNDTGNAFIMLSWNFRHSLFSLKMDFIADEEAKLKKMEFKGVMSQEDFPGLPNKSKNVTSSRSVVSFVFSKHTYYRCNSTQEVKLDNITMVVIDRIQVQAFGVEKTDFTGNGTECSEDLPTEKPTTATMPTEVTAETIHTTGTTHTNGTMTTPNETTTTSAPVSNGTMTTAVGTTATTAPISTTINPNPTNTYSVRDGNVTCVYFVARMDFTFPYTTKNGTNTSALISVPQNFETSGTCSTQNKTINELNIYFFNHTWTLTFVFGPDNSSSQLGDMQFKTYSVKSITLEYRMDPNLFPGYHENDTKTHNATANITGSLFQSKVNGSYKCDVDTEVLLTGNIKLETYHLQYKAFNQDNSTNFGGDLSECSGDNNDNNKTNSVVPIAVGAALAGLVVIVLIAYLIGRRRNRKGYESV